MTHHPFFLRIANTLVYLFFLGSHAYTGYENDEIYLSHPTYLTPSPKAFWIWYLIHFLFGGFVIYQWFPETENMLEHGVGPWFIIAALLSSVQLTLWESDHLILSLLVLTFAVGAASMAYFHLNKHYPAKSLPEHVFVHAPFSMYHGWLTFLWWLNLFAIFTTVQDSRHPDLFHTVLVLLVLIKLAALATHYSEWRIGGDLGGAIVIFWALIQVSYGQPSPVISWTAFVLSIYVVLHGVFRPAHTFFVASREQESAPLLA